jgi:uncharacterized protein
MEIQLKEKPSGCTIVEGFPGLGLIGTISTEYLIKHLGAKSIGHIWSEEIAPVATIHSGKVIQPFEVYYVKKKNLVVVHAMVDPKGMEWKIADAMCELYKTLKAKELITLEGIMSQKTSKKIQTFFLSNSPKNMKKLGLVKNGSKLQEGIIMGVSAALLLKCKSMNVTGVFIETHSKLPDSMASAKILEFLDGYLKLGVDYKPLEKAAADFESQLKDYVGKMEKTQKAVGKKPKHADYMG